MVRYNASLVRKVIGTVTPAVEAVIYDLQNISACAGIKDNEFAAKRARVNHHGSPSRKVPARRFVYDATINIGTEKFGALIRQVIKEELNGPIAALNRRVKRTDAWVYAHRSRIYERAKPFGKSANPSHVQHSAQQIMQRIADQMAQNQINTINRRAYSGADNNGNDPRINQPSTIKRKHSDLPMVDSGETRSEIQAWTE